MLTSQTKEYVSIFIMPTIDLTERLQPSEKGVVSCIGKLSYGNPYKAVILGNNTEQLKTTNPAYGGSQDNEFAYHLSDYFAGYKGKAVVGRVLGNDSKTKILTFKRNSKIIELNSNNSFIVNKAMEEDFKVKLNYTYEDTKLRVQILTANAVIKDETDTLDNIATHFTDDEIIFNLDTSDALWQDYDFEYTKEYSKNILNAVNGVTANKLFLGVNPLSINVKEWQDKDITANLEYVLDTNADTKILTITLSEGATTLYTVSGDIRDDNINDIRDAIDTNIVELTIDENDAIFNANFIFTKSLYKELQIAPSGTEVGINYDTEIGIFGANNIKDWETTPNTDELAIVINACIAEKHSIKLVYEEQKLEVSLYDRAGNKIYSVRGGVSTDSLDEYEQPDFIGMLADDSILTIKTDATSTLWDEDFIFVKEFTNGLVTDEGDKNYANAVNAISSYLEDSDYFMTAGLTDVETIRDIKGRCYDAKTLMVVDIVGNTLAQAIAYKNSLNIADETTCFIWNRGYDLFESGKQRIGLSGWFVGQTVKKNLSAMVDDVESRVSGIAGVDYPIPRVKAEALEEFTDQELKDLVSNRINSIRVFDKKLVLADILSGYPNWSAMRLFPVVEGKIFLDKYIARIIVQKLFKNSNEAIRFVREEVRLLFVRAQKANYFDNDVAVQYGFKVGLEDNDMITVDYQCVMGGVIRRGRIQGTITKKITV